MPKIFVGEISIVALISGTGKVWIRRGRLSSFSVENFLSHTAENFRRGILYCCINFGYQKVCKGGGGVEYQDVPSKFFCLTLPKISVGEISIVALFSGTGKVWIRRGRTSRFSVEIFLSQSAKNFRRGNLYCCINFGYWKSLDKKGAIIKFFRRKFFVSQC